MVTNRSKRAGLRPSPSHRPPGQAWAMSLPQPAPPGRCRLRDLRRAAEAPTPRPRPSARRAGGSVRLVDAAVARGRTESPAPSHAYLCTADDGGGSRRVVSDGALRGDSEGLGSSWMPCICSMEGPSRQPSRWTASRYVGAHPAYGVRRTGAMRACGSPRVCDCPGARVREYAKARVRECGSAGPTERGASAARQRGSPPGTGVRKCSREGCTQGVRMGARGRPGADRK